MKKIIKSCCIAVLILIVGLVFVAEGDEAAAGQTRTAPVGRCSYEGKTFRFGGTVLDLSQMNDQLKNIRSCDFVGNDIVITGDAGGTSNVYFLFDTEAGQVDKIISGSNLIWRDNDLSTLVYTVWNNICGYDGSVIGSVGEMAIGEAITHLEFTRDGSVVATLTTEAGSRTVVVDTDN